MFVFEQFEQIGIVCEDMIRNTVQSIVPGATSHHEDVTINLFIGFLFVILGHILLLPLVFKTLPKGRNAVELLDLYFHIGSLTIIVAFALHAVLECHTTAYDRFFLYTQSGVIGLTIYVGKNAVHFFVLYFSPNCTRKSFWQYMFHHILSIICFASGLYTQRLVYYGCLNALCEISAILLNIVLTWRYFELRRSVAYTILAFSLWISYFITRLILFPCWLYSYYIDLESNPQWAQELTLVERYFYPFTTLVLLVLSIIWFLSITKGFLKAIRESTVEKKKE